MVEAATVAGRQLIYFLGLNIEFQGNDRPVLISDISGIWRMVRTNTGIVICHHIVCSHCDRSRSVSLVVRWLCARREARSQTFVLIWWPPADIPYLAFNSLQRGTHKSEQRGLMNLFVRMFETFRNVTAHSEKLTWDVTEQDALDLLTLVSMLHRRLDASIRTPRTTE
jgi:hypothetical protein